MELGGIDWIILIGFLGVTLGIGILSARRAGKSDAQFFLSGRNMPWWLLGISMVATTFSTDTPNLVTDIVRQYGVAGNWQWWAFLLTGMLTVFLYARLWRRSEVFTDVEFYEIRYSGKAARFLRGFRAIYLGVFFNVIIMSTVTLAAIKISGVMLGFSPWQTVLVASLVTVVFSALGGLRGVILTDFLLFIVAMVGSLTAAKFAVGHTAVGGLESLFAHPNVADKLTLFPALEAQPGGGFTAESLNLMVTLFLIPIAVQWWSVWYPGSEPGGGGYLVQRMLAAKNERHAMGATFFFNAAHYALRPWPWILVALASLVIFPDLASIKEALPQVGDNVLGHDLAYPAMLTFVPTGWLGIVLASLMASYMSTISTHLNWGSSYIVNDLYKRFMRPHASQKELVRVGRISTVLMMVLAGILALYLRSALQAFSIMLQIGAGTGLIFILRWFWWRINAMSEITAMTVSFLIAVYFQFFHDTLMPGVPLENWQKLLLGVGVTTACWLAVTVLGPVTKTGTLREFCRTVNPGGPGWRAVFESAEAEGSPIHPTAQAVNIPKGILQMVAGCIAIFHTLLATGLYLYGQWKPATGLVLTALVAAVLLIRSLRPDTIAIPTRKQDP
jgi:Na+/proline symporter